MLKRSQTTVPYRLFPAELDNLRPLQNGLPHSGIDQVDRKDKNPLGEGDISNPDAAEPNRQTQEKIA